MENKKTLNHKKPQSLGPLFLILIFLFPLILPIAGKVLCYSNQTGHIAVEAPHSESVGILLSNDSSCSGTLANGNASQCTDVPLIDSKILLLSKNTKNPQRIDVSTAASAFVTTFVSIIDSNAKVYKNQLVRMFKISHVGKHFLMLLIDTVILLR